MAVGMGRDTRRQRDVGGSRARGPPPARSRSRSCPGSWARSWRPLAACSPAWPARRGCSSRPSTSAQAHTPRHHLALRAITPHSARPRRGADVPGRQPLRPPWLRHSQTDRVHIVPLRVSRAIQTHGAGAFEGGVGSRRAGAAAVVRGGAVDEVQEGRCRAALRQQGAPAPRRRLRRRQYAWTATGLQSAAGVADGARGRARERVSAAERAEAGGVVLQHRRPRTIALAPAGTRRGAGWCCAGTP